MPGYFRNLILGTMVFKVNEIIQKICQHNYFTDILTMAKPMIPDVYSEESVSSLISLKMTSK